MGNEAAGGNGQAPNQPTSSANGNGQAPTTATTATTTSSPTAGQNGQAPTATTATSTTNDSSSAPNADDLRRMQSELAEARRDAAKYRDEIKKRDDANLSAEQKRERDFSELQARATAQEQALQRANLRIAGYELGAKLGIGDVSAALALLQVEHQSEITYGASGAPENLEQLLKKVIAEHPALAAGASTQRPAAQSGGAANPGAAARTGTFTREQVRRMTPQEYAQNRPAIMEAMKTGSIK